MLLSQLLLSQLLSLKRLKEIIETTGVQICSGKNKQKKKHGIILYCSILYFIDFELHQGPFAGAPVKKPMFCLTDSSEPTERPAPQLRCEPTPRECAVSQSSR